MTETLITSDVDLEANGKRAGYLRLPHSVHRSAYGWIPIPIVVLRNGSGPTILFVAGNHGDEYEGQIAISRLARELLPEHIRGRIIFLPMANFPAADAGTRTSPIDEGNLNRAFPGNATGTPTEMIAHYIEDVLLPKCDYAVDLHSGGSSLYYPSTLLRGLGQDDAESTALLRLQRCFDLPYAWVFTDGGGRQSRARTLMGGANRKGVVCVMAELGGGGSVSRDVLAQTERGLRRVLHGLGMLPNYVAEAARGTRELISAGMIYAFDEGVFEPFRDIAEAVALNDVVGHIHDPSRPLREPVVVTSPADGIVLCKRVPGRVRRGDALYQIAKDIES